MGEGNESTASSFSRRTFLKGSAAVLGLATVTGAGCGTADEPAEPEALPEDVLYQGVCRGNCGGGCCVNVHVRDGKVVKTSKIDREDPLDTRVCQKGLSHAQGVYAANRVQYPMRRVEGSARGAGEWERITWDEAISYISTKWTGYRQEFGNPSIAYTYGAGTYAYNQYAYMRLFLVLGGTNVEEQYDMGALNLAKLMTGRGMYLAGNDCQDVKNAKYVFTWGGNTTLSSMMRWPYLLEAFKNGAKHIVIDPVYNDAASKADLWVPIRPGSDGYLAMAMMNIIAAEGLADEHYMMVNTVAPFLVKQSDGNFLRLSDLGIEPIEGPVDPRTGQPTVVDPLAVRAEDGTVGKVEDIPAPVVKGSFDIQGIKVDTAYQLLLNRVAEYTPEKASEICDIPVDTIKDLTHMFAEGPSNINQGFGLDHRSNGVATTHAQFALAMMAGQMGKPGTGISGSQGQSTMGHGPNIGAAVFPRGAIGGLSVCTQDLPEVMETATYGPMPLTIKSLFVYCANPLSNHVDHTALVKAYDKIELVVTSDSVMTETARYSDVVLPVSHWFEYETFVACPTPYVDFNDKAIEPQFESKSDVEIMSLLGVGMGVGDLCNMTNEDFHKTLLDNDLAKSLGLSWDALKEQKHIKTASTPFYYGNVEIENGAPFSTATGRGYFYLERSSVVPWFNHGQQLDTALLSLPFWEPPLEGWYQDELIGQYPLNLQTHRDRFKTHTAFSNNPWLRELHPEPTLSISPVDANPRGIADGDYVKVYNDRGFVVLKAYLDSSMRPGLMHTEHGWDGEHYADGHYGSLSSMATPQFLPTNHPFDAPVEVEKA